MGEVNQPGEFSYRPDMTVQMAVALAGGFTYRAVRDRISVVRVDDGASTEGIGESTTILQPGDVVNVFERRF